MNVQFLKIKKSIICCFPAAGKVKGVWPKALLRPLS